MRRRPGGSRPRRDSGPVTLHLDDVRDPSPPAADAAPEPSTTSTSTQRVARRRSTVAVAGVLVLLLSGVVTVDRVEARRAEQALRDAPGGVVSLADPPEELWSVPVQEFAYTTLPGLVVVRARDGLAAHDLDSGDERWRAGVEAAVCTGWEYVWTSGTPDVLACLDSVRNPSQVTVVAADGEVVTVRDLDPARGGAWVGPPGTVVRVALVGGDTPVSEPMGSDVAVVLEDATSGEALWEDRVVVEPAHGAGRCVVGWNDISTEGVEHLGVYTENSSLTLVGCWTEGATYDVEGMRLDDPLDPTDFVSTLPDGTFVRVSQEGGRLRPHTTVLDETGAPSWDVPGVVQAPHASDGQDQGTRFVVSGVRWEVLNADGTPRWASEQPANWVAVHARGAAAVVFGSRVVSADIETGDVLWEGSRDSTRQAPHVGSFTDGRLAIFVFRDGMKGSALVEAWDLEDGRIVWEIAPESGWDYVQSIQGRLFRSDGHRLVRLG